MRNNQLGNARADSPEDVDATLVALHVLTLPLYADLFMEDVGRICKIVSEQKL